MDSRIAVIIPNYNGRAHLPRCLNSLLAQDPMPPDIIVVDDCSDDGSADMVKWHYPSVMILEMEKRVGFGAAASFGIRAADHDIVVVMNYDAFVKPGWLRELADHFMESAAGGDGEKKILVYLDDEVAAPFCKETATHDDSASGHQSQDFNLKSDLDKTVSELAKVVADNEHLRKVIEVQKEKLRAKSHDRYEQAIAEGRTTNLEQQIEKLKSELKEERAKISGFEEKSKNLEILEKSLEKKDSALNDSMARAEELWKEAGELREKSKRVDALEKEIKSANLKISELERKRDESDTHNAEIIRNKEKELSDANQRIFELTKTISELDTGKILSEKEVLINKQFLSDFRNDYEKKLEEKENELKKITELLRQKEKETEKVGTVRTELEKTVAEREELEEKIAGLEKKLVLTGNELEDNKRRLEKALDEIDELRKTDSERRIQRDALESNVESAFVREQQLRKKILQLESDFAGQLQEKQSVLDAALSKIDKLDKEIDELIEVNNRLVSDIEHKNDEKEDERRKYREQITELRNDFDSRILDRDEELRVANRRIEAFRDEVAALKEDQLALDELKKQLPEEQQRRKELETKLAALRESLGTRLKSKDRELKEMREQVNDFHRVVAGLENKSRSFARIASENEGYRKKSAMLERTLNELNSSFKKRMQEKDFILEQASNRMNELIISYKSLKGINVEKAALEEKYNALAARARKLEADNENFEMKVEELIEETENLRNRNKDLMAALEIEKEMRREIELLAEKGRIEENELDAQMDLLPDMEVDMSPDSLGARIERSILEAEELLGKSAAIGAKNKNKTPTPTQEKTKKKATLIRQDQPAKKKKLKIKDPKKLIANILRRKEPELLMALRDYYLEPGKQSEGVKLLKNIIYDDDTQALLPAVSLLLGELYGKMGRDKDSIYYLSNPMIRYDEISKHIMAKAGIRIPRN